MKLGTPLQWTNLQPRKLSSRGKQVLNWLEDAETCFPVEKFDALDERQRIIVSDMLRCASEKNANDIGAGASEFARRHPRAAQALLSYLEPLVFPHPGAAQAWKLAPWRVKGTKLLMDEIWRFALAGGTTGGPPHFRLLEQPLPVVQRADIGEFRKQIVNESSRWHLTHWDLDHGG